MNSEGMRDESQEGGDDHHALGNDDVAPGGNTLRFPVPKIPPWAINLENQVIDLKASIPENIARIDALIVEIEDAEEGRWTEAYEKALDPLDHYNNLAGANASQKRIVGLMRVRSLLVDAQVAQLRAENDLHRPIIFRLNLVEDCRQQAYEYTKANPGHYLGPERTFDPLPKEATDGA